MTRKTAIISANFIALVNSLLLVSLHDRKMLFDLIILHAGSIKLMLCNIEHERQRFIIVDNVANQLLVVDAKTYGSR